MDSTFLRALVAFWALTVMVATMAIVALSAIATYGDGVWWASLAIIAIALVCEIAIFTNTLNDPIINWVREPEKIKREAQKHKQRNRPE